MEVLNVTKVADNKYKVKVGVHWNFDLKRLGGVLSEYLEARVYNDDDHLFVRLDDGKQEYSYLLDHLWARQLAVQLTLGDHQVHFPIFSSCSRQDRYKVGKQFRYQFHHDGSRHTRKSICLYSVIPKDGVIKNGVHYIRKRGKATVNIFYLDPDDKTVKAASRYQAKIVPVAGLVGRDGYLK